MPRQEKKSRSQSCLVPSARSRRSPRRKPLGSFTTHRRLDALRASAILVASHEETHHARLGEYAAFLYKEKAMTDVMVVVQTQEFKAHKAVLACYSPYFKEVLVKPGFNDVHYLQLSSVTAPAFEILLEYMYTGELKLTCQELSDVYRAARRLGMKDALGRCIELMRVSPENFENMVFLYVTARKLNLLDASVRAFRLMLLHFERLVMTKEFLDLEVHQVQELLSADEIGARSEVIVFLAALKWINHNYLEREEHVSTVVTCVRFSLMNMEEILACYHPPVLPGIIHFPEINLALLNATCYIAAKSLGQESLFSDIADRSRKFLFEGEPMVLWDVSMFDSKRFYVSRSSRAATKIQAVFRGYVTRKYLKEDLEMANRAATVIQSAFRGYRVRKILLSNGIIIQNRISLQSRKKRTSKTISNARPYLSSRSTFDSSIKEHPKLKNRIMYALGAIDTSVEGKAGQNSLFQFTPESQTWDLIAKCPEPLQDSKLVSMSKSLYVLGGCSSSPNAESNKMVPRNDCYKLELRNKEWSSLPPMNHARSLHGAAVLHGSIYVVGGKDATNSILSSVESYDPCSDSWVEATLARLPEPRMAMGLAAHEGMLWIAGGITPNGGKVALLDTVRCIDLRAGRWVKRCCLPQPMAFPSLLSHGNRLLCIGGATRTGPDFSGELTSLDKIYSYETQRDIWSLSYTMPVQCHSVLACNSGKDLYVLGGFNTKLMSHLPKPFYFDSRDGLWQTVENLPVSSRGYITAAYAVEA